MFISLQNLLPPEQATKEFLGGKGFGLYEMSTSGLNVPMAFALPTTVWAQYIKAPKATMKEISGNLAGLLKQFKDSFGYVPLLSVRSGSRVSCPGMMDTLLNVGIDEKSGLFWLEKLGNACYDNSLARLITMYGSVVKGIDREALEKGGLTYYVREAKEDFPDAKGQLLGAIEAVFKSWNNDRAKFYRKQNNIPEDWGTAVVIQAMVFGNFNEASGTGVLFTRNPATGENYIHGEFMAQAQGEDLVAGLRTPEPLAAMESWNPAVFAELGATVKKIEALKKEVQDIEFTVQDGKLYFLQTRTGKRTAMAAIKIALDMVKEGLITPVEAIKRVKPSEFDIAQRAVIDPSFKGLPVFIGLKASPGVATGRPVFTAKAAIDCKEPCVLITQETTPDDIAGMAAAVGVLTMTGGHTSHAAVVARGMNKPCVVGMGGNVAEQFKNAKVVSIDGGTGKIWFEAVPVIDGSNNPEINEYRKMVIEVTGIIPVLPKAYPGIDTMVLDLGGRLHEHDVIVKEILDTLAACSGKVYVDCRSTGRTGAENAFNRMFQNGIDWEDKLLAALTSEVGFKDIGKKLVMITSKATNLQTMGLPKDLASLVMATGGMGFEKGEKLNLSDPATAKVMVWKAAEGSLKMVALNHFAENMTSVVSAEKAMQLML